MNMRQEANGNPILAGAAVGGGMASVGAGVLYAASFADDVAVYTALSLVGGCFALAGALRLARVLATVLRPWRRRADDAFQAGMRGETRRALESYDARRARRERLRERIGAF